MSINLAWFNDQVEKYTAVEHARYKEYAQVLKCVLENATRGLGPHVIVQARAKSVPSFAEKILRKRHKYQNPLQQLTDLCGARVIIHTKDEVAAVCGFIRANFEIDEANSQDAAALLRTTEFGYRSVHYIVQILPGRFPNREVPCKVPKTVNGLKAEIQVRTIAQHCWADIGHDRIYKSSFPVPSRWVRESARAAAVLEDIDDTFTRVIEGLDTYRASFGSYLPADRLDEEIEILANVLKHAGDGQELAHQLALLLIGRERWADVVALLGQPRFAKSAPHLHCLGMALCQQHRAHRHGPDYARGRAALEQAVAAAPKDVDALTALARACIGIDDERSLSCLERAFALDPTDPQALAGYIEKKIVQEHSLAFVPLFRPGLEAGIRKCQGQAEVGVNLPWAFYRMGELALLLGHSSESLAGMGRVDTPRAHDQIPSPPHKWTYESLGAYTKAVQLSTAGFMIDEGLEFVRHLWILRNELRGLDWVRRLLLLGKAVKFPLPRLDPELAALASPLSRTFGAQGPVVIVAGGCDATVEARIGSYSQLLIDAFRDFHGTIICGGTTAGISGLVGRLATIYPGQIRTVGYLPSLIPSWARLDPGYGEIETTSGRDFSPLEPLQNWIDLIAAGIAPNRVKLLGINGGEIAAFEYRLAMALGATVGVLRESGREASRLLWDAGWENARNLVFLPTDLTTVRAFIAPPAPLDAGKEARETLAEHFLEVYQSTQRTELRKDNPSLAEWAELPEYLKESNRQLADHIAAKLREVGKKAYPVTDRAIRLATFTDKEVEIMAEMEHGRWNAERLLDGWTLGPRDPLKKISPYLLAWADMPDHIKEYDRVFVRSIPEVLRKIGLEVRSARRNPRAGVAADRAQKKPP